MVHSMPLQSLFKIFTIRTATFEQGLCDLEHALWKRSIVVSTNKPLCGPSCLLWHSAGERPEQWLPALMAKSRPPQSPQPPLAAAPCHMQQSGDRTTCAEVQCGRGTKIAKENLHTRVWQQISLYRTSHVWPPNLSTSLIKCTHKHSGHVVNSIPHRMSVFSDLQ